MEIQRRGKRGKSRQIRAEAAVSGDLRGTDHPVIISSSGFIPIDRQITPSVINANWSVPPVQRTIGEFLAVAFLGFEFKVTPPEDIKDDPSTARLQAEALKGLRKADKVVKTLKNIRRCACDTLGYKHAVFEAALKTDGNWTAPSQFKWLRADSLAGAPQGMMGDNYSFDSLLPGIVFDRAQDQERIFQTSGTKPPVEITPADDYHVIIHVVDESPGDVSYMGGIDASIQEWRYARKRLMQYAHRLGVPKATATIDYNFLELFKALPADKKTMGVPTAIWDYLKDIVRLGQGSDNVFAMPPGTHLEYPSISSAKNVTELDQYLSREIVKHLLPNDVLEQLGASISSTSAPVLELFKIYVNSKRERAAQPFEEFHTWWLDYHNGFEDWTVTLEWWPWLQKDEAKETAEYREDFKEGAMPINEYRAKRNLPPLSDQEKEVLFQERQKLRGITAQSAAV